MSGSEAVAIPKPQGRQVLTTITIGTPSRPLDIAIGPVSAAPELVKLTATQGKDVFCALVLRWADLAAAVAAQQAWRDGASADPGGPR